MIYELVRDFENTYSFFIDAVELHTKMPGYKPRWFAKARKAEWIAPEASLYRSENYKRDSEVLPDITVWSSGVLVFSPKAYEQLHSKLAIAGEFLPVVIDGKNYFLFNTLYVVSEDNEDRTNAVEVIDTGVHFGQANVQFEEPFLDNEKILIFKSNTNKLLHSFCTQHFKDLYEQSGFNGLVFKPVIHA